MSAKGTILNKFINVTNAVSTAFTTCIVLLLIAAESSNVGRVGIYMGITVMLFVMYIILKTPSIAVWLEDHLGGKMKAVTIQPTKEEPVKVSI